MNTWWGESVIAHSAHAWKSILEEYAGAKFVKPTALVFQHEHVGERERDRAFCTYSLVRTGPSGSPGLG